MLDSKQRAYLRSLSNDMQVIFQIGKGGINSNMIKQVFDTLEARELIKLHVLNNSGYTAREACEEICASVGANPVSVVGNKFVIYKRSREHKKIILPGEPKPKTAVVKPNSKKRINGKNNALKSASQRTFRKKG